MKKIINAFQGNEVIIIQYMYNRCVKRASVLKKENNWVVNLDKFYLDKKDECKNYYLAFPALSQEAAACQAALFLLEESANLNYILGEDVYIR